MAKLSLSELPSLFQGFERIQNPKVFTASPNVDFEYCINPFANIEVIQQQQKILKKQYSMNLHPHLPNPFFYSSPCQYIATPHISSPFYYLDLNWAINSEILSQSISYNHFLSLSNYQQDQFTLSLPIQPHSQEKQLNTITENVEQHLGLRLQVQKKKNGAKKEMDKKQERKIRKRSVLHGNERFIKKNTQSNVVNQVFSFLWTPEKSKKILCKVLKDGVKMDLFYYLMQSIKIHCKSQLNRHFLKELLSSNDWQNGFKKLKKKIKKIDEEDIKVICAAIRKLVFLYLREKSRFSIMTSKKMNIDLWGMHFAKCRELVDFFFQAQP